MNRPQREVRKRAFKEPEAAEYLAVSRSYLRQDRMNGRARGSRQDRAASILGEPYATSKKILMPGSISLGAILKPRR